MCLAVPSERLPLTPVVSYTICHRSPILPDQWVDEEIAVGPHNTGSPLHISRLVPLWHERYTYAHSAAALFGVNRALGSQAPKGGHVRMQQYRKVLSHERLGKPDTYLPSMGVISASESARHAHVGLSLATGCDFLVPRPVRFQHSVLEHYARNHRVLDFIDFGRVALECGVLSGQQVSMMMLERVYFAGVLELGIYPVEFFQRALTQIETVADEFAMKHAARLTSYDAEQSRALAWCVERMGSFLVLEELRERYGRDVPEGTFGWIVCVAPEGDAYVPGSGD